MAMLKNQYLRPGRGHLPVERSVGYVRFEESRRTGGEPGSADVASGPLVRSPCHADRQATNIA